MRSSWIFAALLSAGIAPAMIGCQEEDTGLVVEGDWHAHGEEVEHVGKTTAALGPTDPVEALVTASCDTSPLDPLATQLVAEVECLSPGAMTSIKGLQNIRATPGQYVFPFLQTFAVNSLKKVVAARNSVLSINSGLRSLPEQYVLYRQYRTGRCGITLAATPGTSNHESGLAVDVEDNAGWRSYFLSNGWAWQGAVDPVHYDIAGGVNMRGLSVRAFQRLWNRNHPEDRIDEDGVYGPQTESKIQIAPIGGFPVGAKCDVDAGAPAADGGDAGETTVSPESPDDGTHGSTGGDDGDTSGTDGAGTDGTTKTNLDAPASSGGCSASSSSGASAGVTASLGLVIASVLATRRRRRAR